jgi:hypothetical protein
MTGSGARRLERPVQETARALVTLVLVMGATAAALATIDAVPAWVQGEPHGVRKAASVEEAERRLKARLFLPAYFPDTLRWPPRAVRFVAEDTASVALFFDGRDGAPALVLAQTVRGPGPISPLVVPQGSPLQSSALAVGDGEGMLSRIVGEDGTIWHEVAWRKAEARLALRGKVPVETLVRMARSAHREGP